MRHYVLEYKDTLERKWKVFEIDAHRMSDAKRKCEIRTGFYNIRCTDVRNISPTSGS